MNRLNARREYCPAYKMDCKNNAIIPLKKGETEYYVWDNIICAIRGCKPGKLEPVYFNEGSKDDKQ